LPITKLPSNRPPVHQVDQKQQNDAPIAALMNEADEGAALEV
jgi:hypothetical protein